MNDHSFSTDGFVADFNLSNDLKKKIIMEGDVVEITKAPIVSSVIRGISIVIIREWKKVEKLSQKYISRREFELTAHFEGLMVTYHLQQQLQRHLMILELRFHLFAQKTFPPAHQKQKKNLCKSLLKQRFDNSP